MGGRTGKKSKEETQEKAKEERSLPVLACPFSLSQKLHNIQTAPASLGFLLLPQYPCCLRLSWTPVNRAMRDHAFCSPIFSCMFWSLFPLPQAATEAGGRCDAALPQLPAQVLWEYPTGPRTTGERVPLRCARPPREQPSGSSGGQTK